tara:strand:+ start:306 stop:572 length:267 start_codon:yes stop_codon:yes gene_type:complete
MKQSDEELRAQINELIRDEIQENINDYVDEKESSPIGFANEEDELKVNIPESEVDKILREYKKIKRKEKSNMSQIKKLGLLDKNGRPL